MRLLIALPDPGAACAIQERMEWEQWNCTLACSGRDAVEKLTDEPFDLLLLHACLARWDGFAVGQWLRQQRLICPPRVLWIDPAEYQRPCWADVSVAAGVSPSGICQLLQTLAKKPLPALAAALSADISQETDRLLDLICMDRHCKGRAYAAWILKRLVPSPAMQELPIGQWYQACAHFFGVRPACVERCIRTAVENVFTQGSIQGIELFFGTTVDPEKGKPTNRAFLMQAACGIRRTYSLADARSPNSSVMHHSPAAPTRV